MGMVRVKKEHYVSYLISKDHSPLSMQLKCKQWLAVWVISVTDGLLRNNTLPCSAQVPVFVCSSQRHVTSQFQFTTFCTQTYMYLCCQGDQHSVSVLHAQHECERFLTHFLLHGLAGEATSSFLNQPTLSRCTAHEHPIIVLISPCKLLVSPFLPRLLPLHSSGVSHEQSCLLHGLAGEATSSFLNQPTYSVSCINLTTTQSSCMGACIH